jgi:transcription elongation GreA/GreB family factor
MDKAELLAQVIDHLHHALDVARRTAGEARDGAATIASDQEKKADARVGLEMGALATGHERRARQLQQDLDALAQVHLRAFSKKEPVGLGAVVEVEDEDGREGRTFFVLPVGAGAEIAGPGGDGVLTVVSAGSPMGRAVLGKRVGESVEVVTRGEPRDWTITFLC